MQRFRILFFTAALLLPASAWGQQQYHPYTIKVCNRGQLAIDVATGFQQSTNPFDSDWWEIDRWYHVNPGKCGIVFSKIWDFDALGTTSIVQDHVHLAFAFTDSTGLWGAATVNPNQANAYYGNSYTKIGKENLTPSNRRFCVHPGDRPYKISGRDPAAGCGGAGTILVPASFDYAAIPDDQDSHISTFEVGFGAGDKAIAEGSGPPPDSRIPPGDVDSGPSLCGKVSCWDLFLQGLARDNQAKGPGANSNGPAPRASTNPRPQPARPAAPAPPIDNDDPIGNGGGISPPNSPAPASGRSKPPARVRGEDVVAYIDASKTGFADYKKGAGQPSQGYRMWDSSVKPAQAQGCWVVQGTTSTTFSCLLSQQVDLNDLRSYYTELTKGITTRLPRDWKAQAEPPFGGDLPNQGYQSSNGAHLEVWISHAESGAEYQIHFELVSAH